jgi:hypothetical protein
MFLNKRRSFIIVEIESMEIINTKKECIEKAIQIINNDQTKLQYALILYYNIFKQFLLYFYNFTYIKVCMNDICYKKFYLKKIKFNYNDHVYSFKKSLEFYIYDNCICINNFNNFKIPYEYITSFKSFDNIICIQILGTIDNIDNNIKIKLSNGIINIYCICDNSYKIFKHLKKNMYYHIKYNKIEDEVITYYTNNTNYTNYTNNTNNFKKINEKPKDSEDPEEKIIDEN